MSRYKFKKTDLAFRSSNYSKFNFDVHWPENRPVALSLERIFSIRIEGNNKGKENKIVFREECDQYHEIECTKSEAIDILEDYLEFIKKCC